MKRIFLAAIILLVIGIAAFAQQTTTLETTNRPTSVQTKEEAREYLNQGRSNSSQFDASQAELNTRNNSNNDMHTFNRLKTEIDRLEASISSEENKVRASLDRGVKVSPELIDRIERLIEQHKAVTDELDAFTSTR